MTRTTLTSFRKALYFSTCLGVCLVVTVAAVAEQAPSFTGTQTAPVADQGNAGSSGRISVYADHPHYFAVDGKPVLLVGATHFNGWTPISMRSRDYRRDLDRLAEVIRRAGNPHVRGLVRLVPYFPDSEGPQAWRRLELRLPAGDYAGRWYDAARGEYVAGPFSQSQADSGPAALVIPSGKSDLVLRLTLNRAAR